MVDNSCQSFRRPPEAPVFTPTEEEFADPLGYIAKIRPIAEKIGLCKIKPPPDWQPPFAVDVEKFTFTPRIQRLNELDATSRMKLNFLDQLAKFWELQGCSLKIPHVDRKLVDLYTLYKLVEEEGGMDHINRERRWSRIATRMHYPSKQVGTTLRAHYEKILYPFYVFKKGDIFDSEKYKKEDEIKEEDDVDDEYKPSGQDYKSHGIAAKTAAGGFRRKNKKERMIKEEVKQDCLFSSFNTDNPDEELDIDYNVNSELKKLQFYGAGPKAAVPGQDEKPKLPKNKMKMRDKFVDPTAYTGIDFYICHMCNRGDGDEYMLLCDGCDDAFHTYCLIPPLAEVPKGDWRCPKCVKQVCSKPLEPYGFDQSKREYTLQSFGEHADQFKSNFFNMPVHMVPLSQVESEFWRLVSSIEEDVCVQYGADIHAMEMGSGFPTKQTSDLFPEDEEYINSGWNLNNLPILEQSVLCHINADISGMKVPWCYVGMCFSAFCWHNEDHWSYSINYLHWGEPKTWYGVPGGCADQFEAAMKSRAPDLFEQSPDLLHQLTTTMNPNVLMDQGVPIVRADQHAGEFMVTFPRSYHAGFNQGYNFAEAVNFCTADWLPMGRLCVEHYRILHRQCVFSHEELVCKMAADPDGLDLVVAAKTYQDLLIIAEREKVLRKKLLDRGTIEAEREAFELLPDDERQCDYCKTTCFLSAVTCSCAASKHYSFQNASPAKQNKIVCANHAENLCHCDPKNHVLRFRYTLDELPGMLHKLKVRAESFDNWTNKVSEAMDASGDNRLELNEIKELITEADEKRYPESELLQNLINTVSEADKCASVANQLVTKKVRTRNRQSNEGKYIAKLSLDELNCFYEQIANLPCIIKEARLVKELLDQVINFQKEAQDALNAETPDSEKLEQLIEFSATMDVDLVEIPRLKQVLQQARWLDEVRETMREPLNVTLDVMRKLMDSGVGLAPHPAVEKAMAELQELLTVSERWEEKARICLQARPRHVMATLEAIIKEAEGIPAYLPNVTALKDALRKAKEWTNKVETVQNSESYPYLDVLETLVNKGRPIPVRLDQLPQVESQVAAAKSWRERTARTFLKKNSTYTLLEVLSPRADVGVYSGAKNRKKKREERERRDSENNNNNNNTEYKVEEQRDPAAIVAAFKNAEYKEYEAMRELRQINLGKLNQSQYEVKYCICRKAAAGFMLQCELCKDWFHGTCVPLPKSANIKNKSAQAAAVQAAKDLKFLCPLCLRSRRPRLETILSLLVSLQKLPVRLPEGEALQCLTERSMAWQDRARQALTTSELASALAKLSVLSQKIVEQAAREKTEKIINAELLKAANNPELQGHLASVTQSAFGGSINSVKNSDSGFNLDSDNPFSIPLSPPSLSQNSDDIQMEVEIVSSSNHTGMSEHAYSSASKSSASQTDSPRKHPRKSPLIARSAEAPVLELSESAKHQLEELMMEGDMLEVSLDETQHIWRILQACQPRTDGKFLDLEEHESLISKDPIDKEKLVVKIKKEKADDPEKKKKKRKKIDEGGDASKPKKIKDPNKVKMKVKIKKEPSKDKLPVIKQEDIADFVPLSGDTAADVEQIKKTVETFDKNKKIADKPKKKKIKKKEGEESTEKKKRKPREKKDKKKMLVDDNEDDADNCAAIKCLKPTGEEVNWVQCDHCEEWYHLLCVGLASEEVKEDEDYKCFKCGDPTETTIIPSMSDIVIKQEVQEDLMCHESMPDEVNSSMFSQALANQQDLQQIGKEGEVIENEEGTGEVNPSVVTEQISSVPIPDMSCDIETEVVAENTPDISEELEPHCDNAISSPDLVPQLNSVENEAIMEMQDISSQDVGHDESSVDSQDDSQHTESSVDISEELTSVVETPMIETEVMSVETEDSCSQDTPIIDSHNENFTEETS
ncbi:lysine-specific demethylase 5A-like isoform X1 [Mytilus californianus]|uniref:lysine-specific demethylase 5A-like isoform X1 n=1 Tax=Mytilus californianus TaxID=6549 RepID=UPI0022484079|nr:lysine-specific demethylase 5A-like isoform X1 [Mytilus californianus]